MNPLAVRFHDACLSALQLDRLVAGEDDSARVHVEGCAKCGALVAELRVQQAAPLPPLRAPLKLVASASVPKKRRVAWISAAAGLAAAASVLLLARSTERTKGAPFSLGLYVRHGSEVRRAAPGEAVAAGDSLRFTVTAPRGGHLAVLSLDPAGHASVYFPLAARAARIEPGAAELALPLSTTLDATLGDERIVGLLCDDAVELEPLRAALERGAFEPPPGCQVTRWSFVKHSPR